MTTNADEPTLRDIADKLDRLDADVSSLKGDVTNLKIDLRRDGQSRFIAS